MDLLALIWRLFAGHIRVRQLLSIGLSTRVQLPPNLIDSRTGVGSTVFGEP
jgi:hypothetical protein